jgi:hypothetical protein
MISRTSWEVNRNGLGACERTLKPDPSREGPSGKCQGQNRNREIRPSGLVGGPEKNVTSSMTRCARLGSIPTGCPCLTTISTEPKFTQNGGRPLFKPL